LIAFVFKIDLLEVLI